MKKALLAPMVALVMLVAGASSATANQEKVTLCHAAGLDGTTHYVELTVGYQAAFGPAGHFYENGTPRAGHEDDYLGPCQVEEETHQYRVVAGMPRFRSELFEGPVGLTCTARISPTGSAFVTCGVSWSGDVKVHRATPPYHNGTYLRLRDVTEQRLAQVILDWRS